MKSPLKSDFKKRSLGKAVINSNLVCFSLKGGSVTSLFLELLGLQGSQVGLYLQTWVCNTDLLVLLGL